MAKQKKTENKIKTKKLKGNLFATLSKMSMIPLVVTIFIIVTMAILSISMMYNKSYKDEALSLANACAGSVEYIISADGSNSEEMAEIIGRLGSKNDSIILVLDKDSNLCAASSDIITADDAKEIFALVCADETGRAIAAINGTSYAAAYSPIEGSDGLSLVIATNTQEMTGNVIVLTIALYATALVISVVVAVIIGFFIKRIVTPIANASARLSDFANGDISSPAPATKMKGEIGQMTDALASMISTIQGCIGDIDNVLGSIADGDLSASTAVEYPGDLGKIKESLELIRGSLSETMTEVARSSSEVRDGAAQLAEGSSTLSQNAVTQAAVVDEITSTVTDIAKKTEVNNRNVNRALETVQHANRQAQEGARSMSEMLVAIEEIETSSKEIEQIMKVIDDIAFQTNILALNAAIEAARAGAAGKGFAVVADEVRNLAGKSADAAKQTGELITKSIEAVNRGAELADVTSGALSDIVTGVEEISEVMNGIASANTEQVAAVEQICTGMEDVNSAIHNTSATAEESAAASEELSALAVSLSDTVARFRTE